MKFKSLFDYRYFLKSTESHITDEVFLLKLKNAGTNEIEDSDYFLLLDSVESYVKEVKLHSGTKLFYKKLQSDIFYIEDIVPLMSFLTHISMGLVNRKKIRDNVEPTCYISLRTTVYNMVDEILANGSISNKLADVLGE